MQSSMRRCALLTDSPLGHANGRKVGSSLLIVWCIVQGGLWVSMDSAEGSSRGWVCHPSRTNARLASKISVGSAAVPPCCFPELSR